MQNTYAVVDDERGFSFRNCRRNQNLISSGFKPPNVTKTGTTICGVIYKDGVVLGCDTRTTNGHIVWEKCCEKIYKIQENIHVAGAGTAADMDAMVKLMRANAEFHRLNTNRKIIPVSYLKTITSRMFFRYGGAISCHFIIGGFDHKGPHIFIVHKEGSSMKLPYATMGSGGYIAMSIFESRWKPDLEEHEAKELVADAITAGIVNDLGSGSNVDLCIIKKNSSEKIYAYRKIGVSGIKVLDYNIRRGTTGVDLKAIKKIDVDIIEEKVVKMNI
ncbi:proteasome subunit beta type-7-like [Chironomus tepperi]|uniref:proteasome subunit beta type-7-like n=1 Tax=Chironomus tepperi TaxID=113505 RepID=UPI00391F2F4A